MDIAEGDLEESNHDEDMSQTLLWYNYYSNPYVYNNLAKTKELVQLSVC